MEQPIKTKWSQLSNYELGLLLKSLRYIIQSEEIRIMDEFRHYVAITSDISEEIAVRNKEESFQRLKEQRQREEDEKFDPNAGSE